MKYSHFVLLSVFLFFSIHFSQSQCSGFPPTVAASDCGLYPPLFNNVSVDPGQTYGLCKTDDAIYSFSGVNLNGGMIRICANTTLSGNWNSGIIVVECGATLSFPNGLLMNNNIGIINYGTVEVTGAMEFQNIGNYFYNESDSARLFVSGSIRTPQNNNQTAYIKNNGYISVGGTLNCLNGCFMCLGENSEIVTNRFQYMQNCGGPTNRITRSNNSQTATIRYSSELILQSSPTANNTIEFWRAPGATHSIASCVNSSALTEVNNAPTVPVRPAPHVGNCDVQNCRTIQVLLPVELGVFDAIYDEKTASSLLYWETYSEHSSDYFNIMRSADGHTWEKVGTAAASGYSEKLLKYSFVDRSPLSGTSYYRIDQYDFDGSVNPSGIRSVTNDGSASSITVYPNPTKGLITLRVPSKTSYVGVYSIRGEELLVIHSDASFMSRQIDLSELASGTYYIRTEVGTAVFVKEN
ncbi:MAG: T9SS type A sorting domain-containing protein [Flavobacteriales bacterium]|nr:T9SS type A sorting domain-containing protein [Flavobacteriales bacterium]